MSATSPPYDTTFSFGSVTLDRATQIVLELNARIDEMERAIPHDELPPEYDRMVARRNAGLELLS